VGMNRRQVRVGFLVLSALLGLAAATWPPAELDVLDAIAAE
jgi:hypothetical protein